MAAKARKAVKVKPKAAKAKPKAGVPKVKKWVFFFGDGKAEGNARMKDLLGGKGSNLAEMTNLKILVPPGFTITTEACIYYDTHNKKYPMVMWEQTEKNLKRVEKSMGAEFGSAANPLLLSVRSGARVSMPGMMDTVLNLGLNDQTVEALAGKSSNLRFAYDAYRRLLNMFGNVVMGMDRSEFEKILEEKKHQRGISLDTELNQEDLKDLVEKYKDLVKKSTGKDFPQNPREQLKMAINAVFESWNTPRAVTYRKLHNIPGDWGTAVNVQAMVFGNLGESSGTGVAFTRNPATGENKFYGEYLMNAQGEDVVAGIRTPLPIAALKDNIPQVYKQLETIYRRLEKHYKDMQDIEFTIQEGKLFMLQTRTGKRTAAAAVKIAVDMVKEKLIDKKTAVLRVQPEQLDQLLHPRIDPTARLNKIAKGLPASPGAAVGKVVFTAEDAEAWAARREKVILVRSETSPEDIGGMHAAKGILTSTGGMTSHAAVVARGMGKCCVAGCGEIRVDEANKIFYVKDMELKEGDYITLNGSTGDVILGQVKLIETEMSGDFSILMKWADEYRTLGVRTNADTPKDSQVARGFGAEGIGLCRTEHMFFEGDRIKAVREMILSEGEEGRRRALLKLLPMQKSDFKGIFEAMEGLPVTIRTLDPPLHEFLPQREEDIETLSREMGVSTEKLKAKIASLHEFNPMLGHRGCRLGITFPEITEMQARAIFEAACELVQEGKKVFPEVMIPLVGHVKELRLQKELVIKVAEEVLKKYGVKLKYLVGTMIEIPRAAITADEIAQEAEFFSFGTNDLTQTTFGFSRDDAGKFLPFYVEKGILKDDPFVTLDQEGVGQLVAMGVQRGRKTRPQLKVGICGEHGGEPNSIFFCHRVGMNYVSCSPFRVPIARLAAAHVALKEKVKVVEMGEK
jgi:pyruvate,orthophosphate dikinase